MRTRFFERTAYQLSDEPVPNCFIKLDDHFDTRLDDPLDGSLHPSLVLAESLCGRMADVEMYAFLLEDARKRHTIDSTTVGPVTHSFFIGYLGACRALMDSAAHILASLHDLPLDGPQRSFANRDFWHQFVIQAPNSHRRYHPHRLFFAEIFRWCSESAARIPPLVLVQHRFGHFAPRDIMLQLADVKEANLERMPGTDMGISWVDALELHRSWKTQFLTICEKICLDLEAKT
jgi:hypothetical protein